MVIEEAQMKCKVSLTSRMVGTKRSVYEEYYPCESRPGKALQSVPSREMSNMPGLELVGGRCSAT